MKKNIYVLFTCDEWKSRDSMRLVGVSTNIKDCKRAIKELIRNKVVTLDDGEKFTISNNWSIDDINNNIEGLILILTENGEFETNGSYIA